MWNIRLAICVIWATLAACQQAPTMNQPHSHSYTGMVRSPRKQGPIDHPSYSSYQNPRVPVNNRKKHGVPSYAVQMEPMVLYSQPDPLYSIEKQLLNEAKPLESSSNNLIKNTYSGPSADVPESDSISRAGYMHPRLRPPAFLSPPRGPRPQRGRPMPPPHLKPPQPEYGVPMWAPPEIPEPPEPIIEIIIRESNETLPAPEPLPTPPPPPKKMKEPVQVFYVKYSKDPNGGYGGEEKVIYEPPVPAVTPPDNNEDPEEEAPYPESVVEAQPEEEVTNPPPPSTTLKAIIRPDSETFDAQGGVKISFGNGQEENIENMEGEISGSGGGFNDMSGYGSETAYGHESAPQPSVVLPSLKSKPYISRASIGEVSTITKRNPGPFNGQQQQFSGLNQASVPSNFQQLPSLPAQDFQPPSLNPTQYSTIPQNYQLQRQQHQQQPLQQQQQLPQRYSTINNPPPIQQQYHTINNPAPSPTSPTFQAFPQQNPQKNGQAIIPGRINSQDQQQQHVEQVNRLQLQQQQLQQQLAQHHRFQQPQFAPQQLSQQPPLTTQFSQQPSQQVYTHHSQQNFAQQSLPQSQFQQSHQNPPHQTHQHANQQQLQPHLQHQQQHHPQSNQQQQQHHQQLQSNQQQQHHQQPQLNQQQQHQQSHRQIQPSQFNSDLHQRNRPQPHRNHRPESQSTYFPTARPLTPTHSPAQQYFKTTSPATTTEVVTEIVTEDPKKVEQEKKRKEEKHNKNVANLPDEVPDDLRQQLLSSGILSNADIEILDYDKIGDIPLENLPPEALANFQQAAGSERVEVRRPKDSAEAREDSDSAASASEPRSVKVNTEDGEMEMKVVRFNPEEDKSVADRYMKKGAKHVAPVVLNDSKYNRYLPLQVSGAQFPVPDIPELRGRNVSSVVVLAPVDYEFLNRRDAPSEDTRTGRSAAPVLEVQGVHFIAGDVLKTLVRMPSAENYRRWLNVENSTSVDKQSVVLLVVGPDQNHPEKEIFMYDISSGRVSKLRGELSATFVQVAESNTSNKDLEEISDLTSASEFGVKRTTTVTKQKSSR